MPSGKKKNEPQLIWTAADAVIGNVNQKIWSMYFYQAFLCVVTKPLTSKKLNFAIVNYRILYGIDP
jgi:hypothetical protein